MLNDTLDRLGNTEAEKGESEAEREDIKGNGMLEEAEKATNLLKNPLEGSCDAMLRGGSEGSREGK
eukprot:13482867-Alexandrium_andersonii.AAC.1